MSECTGNITGVNENRLKMIEEFSQFGIGFSELRCELFNKIRPNDITPLQFEIILHIYCNPTSLLSEISAALDIVVPNASREVKKLIEMGYLVRTQNDEDRRKSGIDLTEKGENIKDDFNRDLGNLLIEKFEHCSESEVVEMITALKTLTRLMV